MDMTSTDAAAHKPRAVLMKDLGITDGEVNFLWWFIQGSIMNPETWGSLLKGYGFCERHAWVHINIEMAFRPRYLLPPTILYLALLGQGLSALALRRAANVGKARRRLEAEGPCLLCKLNIRGAFGGAASESRLAQGKSTRNLWSLASELEPLWQEMACPICAENEGFKEGIYLCRNHLLAEIRSGRPVDLRAQAMFLAKLSQSVRSLQQSYMAEGPKAADADRAGLLAAIGWCSGWRPLLALLN